MVFQKIFTIKLYYKHNSTRGKQYRVFKKVFVLFFFKFSIRISVLIFNYHVILIELILIHIFFHLFKFRSVGDIVKALSRM